MKNETCRQKRGYGMLGPQLGSSARDPAVVEAKNNNKADKRL